MVVSNFGSLTTIHAGLHPDTDLDVATAARAERLLDVELDDRRERVVPHLVQPAKPEGAREQETRDVEARRRRAVLLQLPNPAPRDRVVVRNDPMFLRFVEAGRGAETLEGGGAHARSSVTRSSSSPRREREMRRAPSLSGFSISQTPSRFTASSGIAGSGTTSTGNSRFTRAVTTRTVCSALRPRRSTPCIVSKWEHSAVMTSRGAVSHAARVQLLGALAPFPCASRPRHSIERRLPRLCRSAPQHTCMLRVELRSETHSVQFT